MAWSWKGFCSVCGAIGCGAVCALTGGLAAPALLGYSAVAGGLGFFVGDIADKESIEKEKILMQNERYKDAKNEFDNQSNQITTIKGQIDVINGKINGTIPREPNETDEYLRNQLVILTSQLDSGKSRLSQLRSELDKMRRELSGSSLMSLLGLDKLSFTDKVMIVAMVVLVIWLLKG